LRRTKPTPANKSRSRDRPIELDGGVQERGDEPERGHQRVRYAGAQRVDEAAQRRPADACHLKRAGRQRCRPLQHPLGDDAGQDRGRRGALEGDGGSEHRDRGKDLRYGDPSREAAPGQERRRERRSQLRDLRHAAPIVAVGDMARGEHQDRGRNELHKSDQTKICGAVGERIDLPTDRNRADLKTEFREAASREIEKERRVRKQRAGAGR
jgi:hypothetical protein